MTQPLAIDLFCGLGGWTDGLLEEGYRMIGFDITQHVYGEQRYPAQLVVQDVTTLHGSQFRDASLIVASPPCQKYSYMAMPWTLAKAQAAAIRADASGQKLEELNLLFNACFRIQREACEAAGRHIPLIVENVRGAIPWVGRSRWNFGSFHLWGDVPALMPMIGKAIKVPTMGAGWYPPDHPKHVPGLGFNTHAARNLRQDGIKVGDAAERRWEDRPVKRLRDAVKQGGDWFAEARKGGKGGTSASFGSKSPQRKMAAAMIAKIPLPLSRHIGATFYPQIAQAAE